MTKIGSMKTYEGEDIACKILEYEILEDAEIICEYEGGKKYKKLIRKIKYLDDSEIGYIFGYYYWDLNSSCWRWGQRPLVASQDEMEELIQKARDKGFFD